MEAKMIGSKIAQARKEKNISQAQLAQQVFVSPQAVGKWERGESMPDIITLNHLTRILGVDLNYFATHDDERDAYETPTLLPAPEGLTAAKAGKKLKWDMSRGNWQDADFSGLTDLQEQFSSSNMLRCKFIGSDLSGLLLKNNNVNSCDFSGSGIQNSHIQQSYLSNNLFADCKMNETEFSASHLSGCDLSGADFSGVVFRSGGLEKSATAGAIWQRTSFIETYLADMAFEGNIEHCIFENCAFKRVTFQNAILTNTFFKNKSLKAIKLIDCRADRMTYEFLKNGKADVSGVTMI